MLFTVAYTVADPRGGAEFSIDEWQQRTGSLLARGWLETWIQAAHVSEVIAQHKECVIRGWLVARLRGTRFGVALRDVGMLCPFGWCYAFTGHRHANWRRCARLQQILHGGSWPALAYRTLQAAVRRHLVTRAERVYSVSVWLAREHGVEAEVVR